MTRTIPDASNTFSVAAGVERLRPASVREHADKAFARLQTTERQQDTTDTVPVAGKGATSPANDGSGFTRDELSRRLEMMGSVDNERARRMSDLLANFDAADTDGDGRVSRREAKAFVRAGREDIAGGAASPRQEATGSGHRSESPRSPASAVPERHPYADSATDDARPGLSVRT
jgi:hypothetical protein